MDNTHFLLAAYEGILKTSKDQLIKHYHKGDFVTSLSHVIDSIYLLGFFWNPLIVWNEEKD